MSYLLLIMKMNKAKKPKSSILIHTTQKNNPIIKDFFFIYQYSNEIPCHFQIDTKYYCYYLSLKYYKQNPQFLSSIFQMTFDQTFFKPRFLFLLFDDINLREESLIDDYIRSPIFQINANLFNSNDQSELLFKKNREKESEILSLHDAEIEQMLLDINMLCIEMNVCFILCFSGKEIAQYIYLLSMLDNDKYNPSKKAISNITNNDELIETICYIDLIKKKDANNLLEHYKDITGIGLSNRISLKSISNLSEDKANAVYEFFNYDFKNLNSQ